MIFREWYEANKKILKVVRFRIVVKRQDDKGFVVLARADDIYITDALNLFGHLQITEAEPVGYHRDSAIMQLTLLVEQPDTERSTDDLSRE